jgi:predicted permease
MRALSILVLRLRALFSRKQVEAELDEELRYHLERQIDANIAAGMAADEARYAALRSIAGIEQRKEECRDARGAFWLLEGLAGDLRHAFRHLTKYRTFSAVAVVTLALGIGATTAVYTVAKAVVFAPLPFPHPERVVQLFQGYKNARYEAGGENTGMMTAQNGLFQDWHEQAHSFEHMAASQTRQLLLMTGGRTSVVDSFVVGDGFFETLGVPASLGRHFNAADYAAENIRIVVLADRFWRAEYNADPSIVGRDIVLDGAAHRVVGVMPPGFLPTRWERAPQVWIPLAWDAATKYSRTAWGNRVYARLKAGITLQQAQAEMDGIDTRLRAMYPEEPANSIVTPLDGYLFGHHERLFDLLLAAVGLVLLIACANVANLFLGRAVERQREFAVRSALGASRVVILRQVLVESLVIAWAGGVAGAALGSLLIRPVVALLPEASRIPRLDQVRLDLGVLLFTMIVSLGCGLLFGIVPAIRAGRSELSLALKTGGRGSTPGRREGRLSDSLVILEVALSLVLLVAGGLVTRAFFNLFQIDPGFRPAQSVALQLAIPAYRYKNYDTDRVMAGSTQDAGRRQLYDRLEQAAGSLADVEVAGVSRKLPLRQFWDSEAVSIEGRPPLPTRAGESPRINKALGWPVHGQASFQTVSPGYFGALGIPLVRGRIFDNRDRPDAPMTAVINETAARRLFPDEDPIGKRIANGSIPMTIVGIVGDCRLDGMDRAVQPEVFQPMAYLPTPNAWFIARARGDAASIAGALRQIVHDVDPEVGIVETSTMTSVVGDSLWRERFSAMLIGLFALVAVLIASAGIYAVISHAVEQRTHELGVRMALGARGVHIAHAVLGHGLRVTAMGVLLGTVFALVASRFLAQAYQVRDLPWLLAGVAGLLIVLTALACWMPLRRALAVDPMTTLRAE